MAAVPASAQTALRASRRIYSARDVARALDRMAAKLRGRLEHSNPVVLAVMHGGAFAALELCKRFDFPHEFDYVHVTRYRGETSGHELRWRVRPSKALAGRTVLVVDDILDHGTTLRALESELDRVGVEQRFSAVLVVKRLKRRRSRPRVTVSGLAVEDVYVFGSGMDYRGYWRAQPGIYALADADA
ncbi:MAG TPA: hypoxanthine-guanine phosphoribosyltransferase [Gammaproteobacteria bacterium]|nr:hypoxanthine-guanine phosphoribosyltransferase [Gammaproteobacteria bacterium]